MRNIQSRHIALWWHGTRQPPQRVRFAEAAFDFRQNWTVSRVPTLSFACRRVLAWPLWGLSVAGRTLLPLTRQLADSRRKVGGSSQAGSSSRQSNPLWACGQPGEGGCPQLRSGHSRARVKALGWGWGWGVVVCVEVFAFWWRHPITAL